MSEQTRACEICGAVISAGRLEAVPETRLCIEHARQIGEYGGEFLTRGVQTSLGKGGSLKKNYGDVNVVRKRNIDGIKKLRDDYERSRNG
ncbi:MAG: TraR/DksA C4-type zinc finger protein [Gemmataceae bacterium]